MVSGSKANSASINQSATINSSRVVHAQEFDVSVTMLNIAIILISMSMHNHYLFSKSCSRISSQLKSK
ncbi:hypothetical protein ZIOFF_072451 [Zingiber officinale]|uniref:Uncharacterized protein n=1 Tax=Zingiber officinale TaxID=94328 RepID=A0A8J5C2E3_ZINOF|nr:hypothetical protein ZIOFF_072451 [Zingiber officinale]